MDYKQRIIEVLKDLTNDQLKMIYFAIKEIIDK